MLNPPFYPMELLSRNYFEIAESIAEGQDNGLGLQFLATLVNLKAQYYLEPKTSCITSASK
jgi:hypothetical protein